MQKAYLGWSFPVHCAATPVASARSARTQCILYGRDENRNRILTAGPGPAYILEVLLCSETDWSTTTYESTNGRRRLESVGKWEDWDSVFLKLPTFKFAQMMWRELMLKIPNGKLFSSLSWRLIDEIRGTKMAHLASLNDATFEIPKWIAFCLISSGNGFETFSPQQIAG